MTTGRFAFSRTAVLLCTAVLSGCANMVYTPSNGALNDPDTSGCDQQALDDAMVKSCRRLGESAPVASAAPFFNVARRTAVSDPYKLARKPALASQFFFELTPLGFFAPVFGYPSRETVYTGSVELSNASKFDFRVNGGETFTKTLEFNRNAVTISIRCRPRGCALSSAPPVVGPDGSIRLDTSPGPAASNTP